MSVDSGVGSGRSSSGSSGGVVVDGAVLARWSELGAGRRADVAGRVGFRVDSADVRELLREVGGLGGWGYL